MLSRSTRGRAPSVPLLPPSQIDGGASLPAWSLGGLSREGKEGIAEHERARNERESSARAAGSKTTEKTQGFAKNQRRFRGGLGEMTTPARPSAATLLSLSTCIFGCIFPCIVRVPPPPPRFQARTAHCKRHHPPPASLVSGWCRFYVCSGIYEGAGAVGEGVWVGV